MSGIIACASLCAFCLVTEGQLVGVVYYCSFFAFLVHAVDYVLILYLTRVHSPHISIYTVATSSCPFAQVFTDFRFRLILIGNRFSHNLKSLEMTGHCLTWRRSVTSGEILHKKKKSSLNYAHLGIKVRKI